LLQPPSVLPPSRVVVVGTSGSGKSRVAGELARRFGFPHTELDAIAQGPKWTMVPPEQFRDRLEELAQAPAWVFDGNYLDRTSTRTAGTAVNCPACWQGFAATV
jgi:adenylate kinase family enzyme